MVNKWDICFCHLDPTKGSEQRGFRPILVVSANAINHALPISTVLPISTLKPNDIIYPTEILLTADITGLPHDSIAMVQQIRTVSHSRLRPAVGCLIDEFARKEVLHALRLYFEI